MYSNRVPKSCASQRGVHLSLAGPTPVIGPEKLGRQPMTRHMTSNTRAHIGHTISPCCAV